MSPDDPHMKMVDLALWTYILKVLGELPLDNSAKVNAIFKKLSRRAD